MIVCLWTFRGQLHERDHQFWRHEVLEKKEDHGHTCRPEHCQQRDAKFPNALEIESAV